MRKPKSELFAAKLLFQYRVNVKGHYAKRKLCEERIVHVKASTARQALASVKKIARSAEHKYVNNEGNPVHFQFVGIIDLIYLHEKYYPEEVWYELKGLLNPMQRRAKFVRADNELTAIRCGY